MSLNGAFEGDFGAMGSGGGGGHGGGGLGHHRRQSGSLGSLGGWQHQMSELEKPHDRLACSFDEGSNLVDDGQCVT